MMELAFFTFCGLEVFVCVDRITTGPFLEWKRDGSALLLWLGRLHVVMDRMIDPVDQGKAVQSANY